MYSFAWNVTLVWNKGIGDLDFDYIESLSKDGNKNVYLFWETDIGSSQKFVEFLK